MEKHGTDILNVSVFCILEQLHHRVLSFRRTCTAVLDSKQWSIGVDSHSGF